MRRLRLGVVVLVGLAAGASIALAQDISSSHVLRSWYGSGGKP
jgi:hypothetical protein